MSQSRFAKTRLTVPEYAALCARADEKGITVSEYLRELVIGQRETIDFQAALSRLESKMVAQSVDNSNQVEAMLVEVLLLVRELVAARNAQGLAQVAERVRTLYPLRRAIA